MPDYSNSVIYKIVCKDISVREIYVGSTTNHYKRRQVHKTNCNCITGRAYNYPVYKFIREHGSWDNWEVIELYKYPCNSKEELIDEEARAYHRFICYFDMLNDQKPGRKYKKYYEDNRAKIIEQSAKYYKNNRDFINEKIMCECGSIVGRRYLNAHMKMPFHINKLNGTIVILSEEEKRERVRQTKKKSEQKIKDNKTFYCKDCDYVTTSQFKLDSHNTTQKHKDKLINMSCGETLN